MADKFDEIKKQLDKLIINGNRLYYAMADDLGSLPEDFKKSLKEKKIDLPRFQTEYDIWYSEALLVVKQIIPERLDDFVKQYKNEKRKMWDFC